MFDKNKRCISRHNIPHHAAADTGCYAYKNQKKQILAVAAFQLHGSTDTHYGKNPKTHRIQRAHQTFVTLQKSAFQQFLFQVEQEKQQAGSQNGRSHIGEILEHFWRMDAKKQIPDTAASHCSGNSEYVDAENIHVFPDAQHGAGGSKGNGADDFQKENKKF